CRTPARRAMRLFFFQAEDGIRDGHVTGVQTCALPISKCVRLTWRLAALTASGVAPEGPVFLPDVHVIGVRPVDGPSPGGRQRAQIGRASCRERVKSTVVDVVV